MDNDSGDGKPNGAPSGSPNGANGGKKVIWMCVIAALAVLVGVGVIYYDRIVKSPGALFERPTPTPSATQAPVATPDPNAAALPTETAAPGTPSPSPSPTPDPYTVLQQQADLTMMKDVVNILLVGVDYAPERDEWSGKHAYHADVMMVVAVNFDEGRADMISLPRDTYAHIPGVEGIYKLNASIDCGGGYPDGFPKVAEAASWMLGGIPVDYYYGVTMPVVKELVDTVGGVEYDLDIDFKLAGREYKKGVQHMDGQAVLDYLRVRKNIKQSGDLNRVNRQKNMLLAVFNKMKRNDQLVKLPQLVQRFAGKLITNTTLEQTAALALFAYNMDADDIGMHSMDGTMKNIFNWNFCLTDQNKRVKLIEEIYGVKVEKYPEYSKDGALKTWAKLRKDLYFDNAQKVLDRARAFVTAFSPQGEGGFGSGFASPSTFIWSGGMLQGDFAFPAPTPTPLPASMTDLELNDGEVIEEDLLPVAATDVTIWQQIDITENCVFLANNAFAGTSGAKMEASLDDIQVQCDALALMIGMKKPDWSYEYEKTKNEIVVDFR